MIPNYKQSCQKIPFPIETAASFLNITQSHCSFCSSKFITYLQDEHYAPTLGAQSVIICPSCGYTLNFHHQQVLNYIVYQSRTAAWLPHQRSFICYDFARTVRRLINAPDLQTLLNHINSLILAKII